MKRYGGFTLIEVLIVVVIVGILAAVALPSYRDYVLAGKFAEATSVLSNLRARIEQYYADNRRYDGFACVAGLESKYFNITCEDIAAGANTYTLKATGIGADVAGYVFSIDQSDVRQTVDNGTTKACWITKKGQSC